MTTADFSKAAVFRYLDNVTRQGILNVNTSGGLRAAATKLLEDLADEEDVRNVDVEGMAIRYHNKHPGDLSTDSLRVYKKRVARLLKDFSQYTSDPLTFKPKARSLSKSAAEKPTVRAGNSKIEKTAESESNTAASSQTSGNAVATKSLLSLPYPLREDFVAQVVIPRNITSEEAKRLCAFITTLAIDFKPTGV